MLVFSGCLLVAIMAQVRIPLPFTPVPITGQTFAVLLVGAALGSRRGLASLGVYLLLGALGLPFFAGGTGGIVHLFGPTAGYLFGFLASAWVVGRMADKGLERRFGPALLVFLAGTAVIYLFGLTWLGFYIGFQKVLAAGLFPFLIGDVIKLAAAAAALPAAWKLVR
jgi:biotin transport system substrate-specific component